MSVTPVNASLTVTTAGTRVRVSSNTALRPTSIYVEALGTNTGYIYVGLVTVSSTVYIARLSAGQSVSFSMDGAGLSGFAKGSLDFQLSDFYIDSSVNGEKALITYADVG